MFCLSFNWNHCSPLMWKLNLYIMWYDLCCFRISTNLWSMLCEFLWFHKRVLWLTWSVWRSQHGQGRWYWINQLGITLKPNCQLAVLVGFYCYEHWQPPRTRWKCLSTGSQFFALPYMVSSHCRIRENQHAQLTQAWINHTAVCCVDRCQGHKFALKAVWLSMFSQITFQ